MQRRSIVAGLAATVVLSLLGAVAGSVAAQPSKLYFVFGYYPVDYPGDTAAFDSLVKVDRVDPVGAFLFQVDESGNILGRSDPKLMELARSRKIAVEAVLHNYRGGFDRGIATSILTNPQAQDRLLDQIEGLLKRDGYQGVQIDLENVDPQHRPHLNQFMRRVAARLRPQGFSVSIAVPAKTWDDPTNGWSGAFDYRTLGQIVDLVSIMTYDEHWAGAPPGPVASLPWVREVARYASQTIPKEKVLLGVAGYGYDWSTAGGMGQMVKGRDAERIAAQKGVPILWDDQAKVPYFRYVEGGQARVVYFENAQSTRHKLQLIVEHGLGGMALWRLGFEDPQIWPVVEQLLGSERPPRATPPPGSTPPGEQPPGGEPPVQPPPGSPPPAETTYTVQPGDTLYLIGLRYGLSWQAIAQANPGVNPWWLMPGQRLRIPVAGGRPPEPPPAGRTHVVQPGDTLYLIGLRYGLSWQAIAQANPGVNPWWLMPGQRLLIPGR